MIVYKIIILMLKVKTINLNLPNHYLQIAFYSNISNTAVIIIIPSEIKI